MDSFLSNLMEGGIETLSSSIKWLMLIEEGIVCLELKLMSLAF